ncbi:DUF1998 domain-containing protein [Dolichospermum sp. ST_con]|nr:DUF1998 domain-containing protein [Dolichospermum sp. ST_con]MDD1419897.1 DUF1998 domain-containing protein [Dolichospermum sp. ST_sed1]MDD1426211.1 DUF1998 domain-containing protein [Dolichospermum sp. ST_sed9]MDD1436511.1 DUF1998 domain-containing protein [Dolichospermum sp. ST_sed10]MDD1443407.1 DUF1998 domain-containing protein [Dolichospermum sp. ST_sed3]MDD1448886.1 DUF1998 domain-containing protein [Dolichospermum sp. ST_sed8]MDD1457473.1 DUF1998 domain-containing protein [Dolichosp
MPSEGKQTEGQGSLLDVQFVPANNVVIAEAKPALAEENIKPILEATIPTAYKIREELEAAIIADLLGPAGGEDEELDEKSVSDRYLVGLLAPQHRRITEETIEKSSVVNQISKDDNADKLDDKLDDKLREVDCYLPGNNDELAISGKGTVEDGSTEVNVPPLETMFPSSFGMTFCVNGTAKALQITSGWGQYHRTDSGILNKVDSQTKKVWKREQIRSNSPTIPLIEGVINNWIVDPQYPEVYVKGQIRKQNNGDFIVSLFLINGQRETKEKRDETWLFQPELRVKSADSQHPDIFLKRHQPRSLGKLDPVIYTEEKTMAMLYRKQVEFAIGHGVSVHAKTASRTEERAVELSISVIPTYEVPKTSPPQVDEIPELAGLVLDMQELSTTATGDFANKISPLITAYQSWINTQKQRISDPATGLTDYENEAKTAIQKCEQTLNRIREGLTLLQTDEKAADAFRFMNQAMYLQRVHSIYSEQIRQNKTADLQQISLSQPRWFPFQLAFILLNLPSITNLHHPDRSHPQDAVADLLWFPTGGYNAASLKERIYSKRPQEEGSPMAGVLIYTAAPDSEGTLGGLVSLGEPKKLGYHIDQALEQMQLCTSDPLCAEHTPLKGTTSLHWAACHGCLFSPETSCERGNKYLDRAVLVPTVLSADLAFFPEVKV